MEKSYNCLFLDTSIFFGTIKVLKPIKLKFKVSTYISRDMIDRLLNERIRESKDCRYCS